MLKIITHDRMSRTLVPERLPGRLRILLGGSERCHFEQILGSRGFEIRRVFLAGVLVTETGSRLDEPFPRFLEIRLADEKDGVVRTVT